MCDCHPRSKQDEAIWRKAKEQPRTREEWRALHNAIEDYRSLIIQNWKGSTPTPQGK